MDSEREKELPYLSRRRAVPEDPDRLALEPWPRPHPPPLTAPRAPPTLPASIPARSFTYEELWRPEALRMVEEWLTAAQTAMVALQRGERPRAPRTLILTAEQALQPFAAPFMWDCRDPASCRPLVPSTPSAPPPSSLDTRFIVDTARDLRWPDQELLHHVQCGVNDDASNVASNIVLCFHHGGLVTHFAEAQKAVSVDIEAGFIKDGFKRLPIVPIRLAPRNIAQQTRWSVTTDGSLTSTRKSRLTTDDSWNAYGDIKSRNESIDPALWPKYGLPSTRDLGRAAAILLVLADAIGVQIQAYARDLSAAYRAWGVNNARLYLQAFVWINGVAVDERLEFGTSSAPQIFQRLTSMLCARIRREQLRWDQRHPPSHPAARAWQRARELELGSEESGFGYAHAFLDDINGVALDDSAEDWPEGRAAAHFAIAGDVLTRAGFTIQIPKDQLGTRILALGFRLNLQSRRLDYPPEKADVLRAHISELLRNENVSRKVIERVVGIEGHLCAVLAEGRLRLDAGYAFLYARRERDGRPFKPTSLRVGAASQTAQRFREAQRWFAAALTEEVSVPLAPRLSFPAPGHDATAFAFVDASRTWGVGGWSVITSQRVPPQVVFAALAEKYPESLRDAATRTGDDGLSTAAIEIAAADLVVRALRRIVHFTNVVLFTDSEAARGAINAGSSMAPRLRPLVDRFFSDGIQCLALRVSTTQNKWADMLSRGKAATVAQQAGNLGWELRWMHPSPDAWKALEASMTIV